MNRVIDLRAYADPAACPTLVLVDMQQEYVAGDRMLAIAEADGALANCRMALAHARQSGFPVAFVRWQGRSSLFNRASPFSRWIEGFAPGATDMVFERDRPSCYASPHFAEVMEQSSGHFVIAGFAGEAACLATAIDAFHRGHTFTYLYDASASHAVERVCARDVHQTVAAIVDLYDNVITTDTWIRSTPRPDHSQRGQSWKTMLAKP